MKKLLATIMLLCLSMLDVGAVSAAPTSVTLGQDKALTPTVVCLVSGVAGCIVNLGTYANGVFNFTGTANLTGGTISGADLSNSTSNVNNTVVSLTSWMSSTASRLALLGTASNKNTAGSVTDPGTGNLEALLPIQTPIIQSSYTFGAFDLYKESRRSNNGSAMSDTLPASTTVGLVNGTVIQINNVDTVAVDNLIAGSGTTISGATTAIGPGRSTRWIYDTVTSGTPTWRPTMNSLTALLINQIGNQAGQVAPGATTCATNGATDCSGSVVTPTGGSPRTLAALLGNASSVALTSASSLTLPAQQAPFASETYKISGNSAINQISGGVDGREITLLMQSTAVLINKASGGNLALANDMNFVGTLGALIHLRYDAINGGYWTETWRNPPLYDSSEVMITGGTMDGVTIGSKVAAQGTFTTIALLTGAIDISPNVVGTLQGIINKINLGPNTGIGLGPTSVDFINPAGVAFTWYINGAKLMTVTGNGISNTVIGQSNPRFVTGTDVTSTQGLYLSGGIVTGSGTSQSTATVTTYDVNSITACGSGASVGSGMIMQSYQTKGAHRIEYYNRTSPAVACNVYPPSGAQIEGLAAGSPVVLNPPATGFLGDHVTLTCISATQCLEAP